MLVIIFLLIISKVSEDIKRIFYGLYWMHSSSCSTMECYDGDWSTQVKQENLEIFVKEEPDNVCCYINIYFLLCHLQQNRLQWYGHVLQKEDNDWAKKRRVPGQEVDQRKLGETLWKKSANSTWFE